MKFCDECMIRLEKIEEHHGLCKQCRAWEDVRNFERIFGLASSKTPAENREDCDEPSSYAMA
jgi:anaerobic ribonucleoside-triphosphate reductase